MKISKRILIESILVSIIIFVLPIVIRVIQGLISSKKYVPDIIDSYATANYQQHKVSFGIVYINEYSWVTITAGIGVFILVVLLYIGIRIRIDQWIKRKRSNK